MNCRESLLSRTVPDETLSPKLLFYLTDKLLRQFINAVELYITLNIFISDAVSWYNVNVFACEEQSGLYLPHPVLCSFFSFFFWPSLNPAQVCQLNLWVYSSIGDGKEEFQ